MKAESPFDHVDPPRPARHRDLDRLPDVSQEPLRADDLETLVGEGLAKYGAAFAAYLSIDGLAVRSTLLLEFVDDYAGCFPDMRTLMDDTLEALGWHEPLRHFLMDEPQLEGLVTWDYEALEQRLRGAYDLVEYGGVIYQFAR